jgi:ribonuclease HI
MNTIIWTLFVDGASRNNPGPAGAGIYIEKDGVLFLKCGYYLGLKTNNQAEYLALLLGLFTLNEHAHAQDTIVIVSDSKLLVEQISGNYKVKQPHLQSLYQVGKKYLHSLNFTIKHVLRDHNTYADQMANYGVDNKIAPPKKYIALLNNYDIYL